LRGALEDQDFDDSYDHLVTPQEGQTRVFAVPRVRKCISTLFIRLINLFGNEGGFDLILNAIKKDESESGSLDINMMGILVSSLSTPYQIYHRAFIADYGPQFVDACLARLRNAPEKSLRDVRRERIESIIKSIDNFQRRLVTKEEREKQTEILRLEVALMCLKSTYLERRIQGIRDLNSVIKNNRLYASKSFTSQYLIQWISENGVYPLLFDPKQTHLQLVQRCNDIIKLLLHENLLS
jgi:ubiquitin carboxyl-terminal hydrolase 34